MSVYYPDNCEDIIPDHICDNCGDIELGGIRSVGYLRNTAAISDPSDPTEWEALFAAGDLILIPETKGTFDGGSPVFAPGYGDQQQRLVGYNFTLTYQDPNYKQNCDFYNAMKFSRGWKFVYRTETQIHIVDYTVQATPTNPVEEDKTTEVTWNVSVTWTGKNNPCPYDVPPGLFDRCVANS